MKNTANIGDVTVTKSDLHGLKKMQRLAKQYATLHAQLSGGCNHVLFELHNQDSSVNHLARWIEQNTTEAVEHLNRALT